MSEILTTESPLRSLWRSEWRGPGALKHTAEVRSGDDTHWLIVIEVESEEPVNLHFGMQAPGSPLWKPLEATLWPPRSKAAGATAVTSEITAGPGRGQVAIRAPKDGRFEALSYVLQLPGSNRWENNRGQNYRVPLPAQGQVTLPELAELRCWPESAELHTSQYSLESGELRAVVEQEGPQISLHLWANLPGPLTLHWGLSERAGSAWQRPSEAAIPEGSTLAGDLAVNTAFHEEEGLMCLDLRFTEESLGTSTRGQPLTALSAVLFRPQKNQWLKAGGRDFSFPLRALVPATVSLGPVATRGLVTRIVEEEVGANSWTLMHRFELCTELMDRVGQDLDALRVLYVWLRYSAIRQLDWQRRYNTQPRRLSHAQDRLTRRIAALWRDVPGGRGWAALMLGTLGRGGNGQRVRDDILAIMHRHHISEVHGTFIEQWHQKLHNNTTPDDIAICDAYLAFLRSGGDVAKFYSTLEGSGVDRERLKSYDRAITTDPVLPSAHIPGLIGDFEQYRTLLASVHGSTDLRAALDSARGALPPALVGLVDRCFQASSSGGLGSIVEARRALRALLDKERDDGRLRDLLYLDLALVDHLRCAIESQRGSGQALPALFTGTAAVAASLGVDFPNDQELAQALRQWERLVGMAVKLDTQGALQARSAVDRLSRWVAEQAGRTVTELEPTAIELGTAFHAQDWAVRTFAEEVVRGGPLFALGSLLGEVDRQLRKLAGIGPWQVVSPGQAFGTVHHAATLMEMQGHEFALPTILVADRLGGEEEIPPQVLAVISPTGVDLLSHLAVRARNAAVLLATVWDPEVYAALAARAGERLSLASTPAGTVELGESGAGEPGPSPTDLPPCVRVRAPNTAGGVFNPNQFTAEVVGAKARVLAELRQGLPEWIRIPKAVALGFGTFERVLEFEGNREIRKRLETLWGELGTAPEPLLAQIRETVLGLQAPPALAQRLIEEARSQGLPSLEPFEASWRALCRVWGSKWTDRAHFARAARGIPSDQVFMSVLVQEVVNADYAFVLHTKNPQTGDPQEIYGEMVLGLGEVLVGNYPGRALGFVCSKTDGGEAQVVSYPSKSQVLRAQGLIFRSDSNAEDLEGFAGAGLHDSVTAAPLTQNVADYSQERLVWDAEFRRKMIGQLVKAGLAIERRFGAPQDIEGAFAGGQLVLLQSRPQVGR